MKWLFILFNISMLILVIFAYMETSPSGVDTTPAQGADSENAAMEAIGETYLMIFALIAGAIGLAFWFVVDVILALIYFLNRAKKPADNL